MMTGRAGEDERSLDRVGQDGIHCRDGSANRMVGGLDRVGRAHRVRIDPAAACLDDVVEKLKVILIMDAGDDFPIRGPERHLRASRQQVPRIELNIDRHESVRVLRVRTGVVSQEDR
jgi:hypothetical protein